MQSIRKISAVIFLSFMMGLMSLVFFGTTVRAEEPDKDTAEAGDEEDYGAIELIAHGEDGGVSWKILKNYGGYLVVNVTGNLTYNPVYDRDSAGKPRFWPWNDYRDKIKRAKVSGSGLTNAVGMFYNCSEVVNIDLSELDTSAVTDMGSMFVNCSSLTALNLSGFDTRSVTNMYSMFVNCVSLTELDVTGFDTKKVESFYSMFDGCRSLTELDVTGFDTSRASNMGYMFDCCRKLKSIDLSHFDTSNVTLYMTSMFRNCESLTYLDISSFDISRVYGANTMLEGCVLLEKIKTPKKLSDKTFIDLPRSFINSAGRGRSQITDANDLYRLPGIKVTSVTLDKDSIEMMKGDTEQLNATVYPDNADCRYVIWSSDDEKVVTVDQSGKVTATGKGSTVIHAYSEEGLKEAKCHIIVDSNDPEDKTIIMYRLYNPNSGEHFYTGNAKEIEDVVAAGWKNEGLAWKAPKKSKTPVYRVYNPNAGDHHYTVSVKEKNDLINAGWRDEGIGWYSDDEKHVPLHRLYNPNAVAGAHHYTISTKEKDDLVKAGWSYEGLAWYGK